MDGYKDLIVKISSLMKDLSEIAEEEGFSDDFSYVFCFGIDKKQGESGVEYTAGYSWNTKTTSEFDELLLILGEAYDMNTNDKDDLLGGICLN
tara:strand:- start:2148 stop:2426 length:279 start_codon:yes stop_codon:yes gene_type:complete